MSDSSVNNFFFFTINCSYQNTLFRMHKSIRLFT